MCQGNHCNNAHNKLTCSTAQNSPYKYLDYVRNNKLLYQYRSLSDQEPLEINGHFTRNIPNCYM